MKRHSISAIAVLLILSCTACAQKVEENVTVTELSEINFNKDADTILLDVRTEKEYDFGRVPHSRNIDVLETDNFKAELDKLDKSKHYYIICRSGSRSLKALEIMKQKGFKHLYNVEGGFVDWEKQNFPVEK